MGFLDQIALRFLVSVKLLDQTAHFLAQALQRFRSRPLGPMNHRVDRPHKGRVLFLEVSETFVCRWKWRC